MIDDLNKEITKYNNLNRDDYGIFLTKEQKDVILNFTKKQLLLHNVSQQRELLVAVFEKMTRPQITMLEIGDYEELADELLSN